MSEQAEWVEIFTAPRFAGLSGAIKDGCWKRGLKLDISIDKGWVRETIRIKVTGDKIKLHDFRTSVYCALAAYNS